MKKSSPSPKSFRLSRISLAIGACLIVGGGVFVLDTAGHLGIQPLVFSRLAKGSNYWLDTGPSDSIRFTHTGPYDHRLGYAALPHFIERLQGTGYTVGAQARISPALAQTMEFGLFAPYREKTQAGLSIFDCHRTPIFAARYPERVYGDFDDVPSVLVDTLLFVENRELLDEGQPHRNPAVDVERFVKAVIDQSIHYVYRRHDVSGGSTLATQIEKYRHSPSGRTENVREKMRQMLSASLRAYRDGADTRRIRRQVVLDYLNTVPLAAHESFGEVNGLGDGLWVWFGRDWREINRLLAQDSQAPLAERALAFKQVLALVMSERRPSFYLLRRLDSLEERSNSYLRLLAANGIIAPELRDAALRQPLVLRQVTTAKAAPFRLRKAVNVVRLNLSSLLDVPNLYDLDRLDLSTHSTLDARLQDEVSAALAKLNDVEQAKSAGLIGPRMLKQGGPQQVTYSFILYERTPQANLLRVQADSLNEPWDINTGAKLDLGSTAKLRTLLTYLGIVAGLHERYAGLSVQQLRATTADPRDAITRWALEYLAKNNDRSLPRMLEASLTRTYSANPGEAFFTGGGVHYFQNFDKDDNHRIITIREGLLRSVNLVFVRLMRDVVRYFEFNVPGSDASILADVDNPQRLTYLRTHADNEGREFLRRFYKKYAGKSGDEALDVLVAGMRVTPPHLAAVYRYVVPDGDEAQFAHFILRNAPEAKVDSADLAKLYREYSPEKFNLADRGYVARVHPLELWLLRFLRYHPGASFADVIARSGRQRQEVYAWLFHSRFKHAQDLRISSLLEKRAFEEIHRDWERLGYPFETLVPSYATALGASADRPAALAELMGIVMNDGMRLPNTRMESLNFAVGTPYETRLVWQPPEGRRVLRPEIARLARTLLADVVARGTAQRLNNVYKGEDNMPLAIGGKTGTGDVRFDTFGKGGRIISSKPVGRTGTFVFYLGDRYFGSLTAYVRGPAAAQYSFTSSLPLQVMKSLAPVLRPALVEAENERCTPPSHKTIIASPQPRVPAMSEAKFESVAARTD